MYNNPSGPVLISVIPPKPVPNIIEDNSCSLSTTRSETPLSNSSSSRSFLWSLTLKKYRLPPVRYSDPSVLLRGGPAIVMDQLLGTTSKMIPVFSWNSLAPLLNQTYRISDQTRIWVLLLSYSSKFLGYEIDKQILDQQHIHV